MPPQQPGQSNTPYDFFLAPPSPQRQRLRFFSSSQSLHKRLIVVVAGGLVLILVIIAVSSLFHTSSDFTKLITVAQDQNELIRVATEANQAATVPTTQDLAQNVELGLTSAQQQILTYLQSNGHTLSSKQLDATKDLGTDQTLTAATATSTFDTVFSQVMQTELKRYVQDLNAAYPSAGPKARALLQTQYKGAELLLTEAQTVASTLSTQ